MDVPPELGGYGKGSSSPESVDVPPELVDSSDEDQCGEDCCKTRGKGKRAARKNRWTKVQGQKVLNELEFEKILDKTKDVKGKLDIFKVIEPEGFNEIEEKG